jgi:glycosyltransferase involved in cell wall biosynthesis
MAMRVLLVDPSNFTLPYDAALARGLAGLGHEVQMIGRTPDEGDGWAGEGVPFHRVFYRGLERLRGLPRPLFLGLKGASHGEGWMRLLRLIADVRPDAVHIQWFPLPLVDRVALPVLRKAVPVVLTMHDTEPFNGNPSAMLQRMGALSLPRRCDRVIVHTGLGAERLAAAGVAKARVAVIPHGALGRLPPDPPPPPDPPEFLVIGKIKPYKGIDVFIDAVARLPAPLRAKARFTVAGKPYMDTAPFLEAVREADLGETLRFDFRFLSDAEMEERMARAAVLVFPYREIEASGILALSLGHGRAILASGIGGFAETLRDGIDARLVPPGDPDRLAAAMTALIENPEERRRLGRAARALGERLTDWRAIAERTAEVYAEAGADRVP